MNFFALGLSAVVMYMESLRITRATAHNFDSAINIVLSKAVHMYDIPKWDAVPAYVEVLDFWEKSRRNLDWILGKTKC